RRGGRRRRAPRALCPRRAVGYRGASVDARDVERDISAAGPDRRGGPVRRSAGRRFGHALACRRGNRLSAARGRPRRAHLVRPPFRGPSSGESGPARAENSRSRPPLWTGDGLRTGQASAQQDRNRLPRRSGRERRDTVACASALERRAPVRYGGERSHSWMARWHCRPRERSGRWLARARGIRGKAAGMSARVLVIGFDACEASLVRRWAAEGKLPNFAALVRASRTFQLDNPMETLPGAIWPE